MATEFFKDTMKSLKIDYVSLAEEDKRIVFTFKDYLNAYLKWLEVGGDQSYTEQEEELFDNSTEEEQVEEPDGPEDFLKNP